MNIYKMINQNVILQFINRIYDFGFRFMIEDLPPDGTQRMHLIRITQR